MSPSILFFRLPFVFSSNASAANANRAISKLLGTDHMMDMVVTSEEAARLLEEAAAIATAPQDWRPVEMLPEDYYAL